MADQRASPRIRLDAWIDVAGSRDVLLFNKIRDLSLGGVSVETESIEPVGSQVDVVINFPELDETISATGTVIRIQDQPWKGMVIRFNQLQEDARKVIERYIGMKSSSNSQETAG